MRAISSLLFLLGLAIPIQAQSRTVAITVDDLPCANCAPMNPDGTTRHGLLEDTNQRLVAGLGKAHIPVTGFVVTQTAQQAGASGQHALQRWLDAGFDLGNHSDSHPNFADITLEQMEAEISRADETLRPLVTANGRKLQFFRFPYNDTGDTQAKHDGIAAFLKDHGYQVATCTIDTSDYVFASAYARALGADDAATAARIRSEYLAYSATEIDFYAALNRRVLGYEPPQVMLIHDSLLNADSIDGLLALFRTRGYSFVSLADAQRDPAYAAPDTFVSAYGPMWGYRWAKEKNLGRLGLSESEPPDWITAYADGKLSAAQTVDRDIDPAIAQVLATTPAIDDHAHPMLSPPEDAADRNFDALPVDNMAPQTDPLGWRPDDPALADAWHALWGLDLQQPLTDAQQKQLDAARSAVKARVGKRYSEWVLDRANIQTMNANRVSMGTGVQPPRFLWVPYDDALLFPLDNSTIADTPDKAQFFPLEKKLLSLYYVDSAVKATPPTLDAYINKVVLPTLQRQHDGGAVAVKFELAYLRPLDIGNPTHDQAAAIYKRFAWQGKPSAAEYKPLQDFLFRVIARRAGQLGMAVHFHGMAGGGRYFSIAGVNPLNLEPLLNDSTLSGTNFVLLHGGWPFVHEAGAMLQKPNFYLDISQQAIIIPPRTLATWLREWLEMYPEKVLFATDGYPYSGAMGWEESTWLASRNARRAIGLALTGMQRDGEITPDRAAELARMVLHDNAARLYHQPLPPR